jgi:two-component system alkaline phosphatase synthesis response regulator PhoP
MSRILIVEDEQHLADGLRFNLQAEGHDALIAPDGERALALILGERQPVDVVILDVMLPGLDGYEVCRRIRADGLALPILFLSARGRESDKVVGLELGADDYITKPFGVSEFLARVKAALRRSRREENRKLRAFEFGPVTLDFERYRATRGGKPLALTAREFAILAHFIRHRGKVVTREDLLVTVWGHEVAPETRTVDTHLAQLRKKIEKDPARPKYLVSVRGAGYRFEG